MKTIKNTDVKKEFALGVIKTRLSVIASNLVSDSIVFSDEDKQTAYFNLGGKILEPKVTIDEKGRKKSNMPIVGGYVEVKGDEAKIDMGIVPTIYASSKVKNIEETKGFPPVKIMNKKDDKLFGTATFATNIKKRTIEDVLDADDKHLIRERLLNIYTGSISQVDKINDTKSKAYIPEDTTKQRVLTLTDKGAVENSIIEAKYISKEVVPIISLESLTESLIEKSYPKTNEVGAKIDKNSILLFDIVKEHNIVDGLTNFLKIGNYWYVVRLLIYESKNELWCSLTFSPMLFMYNKENIADDLFVLDFYIPYVNDTKNVYLLITKDGFWVRYNNKNYMVLSFELMKNLPKHKGTYYLKFHHRGFTVRIDITNIVPLLTNEFYGSYQTGDLFVKTEESGSVSRVGEFLEKMFSDGEAGYFKEHFAVINSKTKFFVKDTSVWYFDFVNFMPACGDVRYCMTDSGYCAEQAYIYNLRFKKKGTILAVATGKDGNWGVVGYFSYLTDSKKSLKDVFNLKIDTRQKEIYFENTRTKELLTIDEFKEKYNDFYVDYQLNLVLEYLSKIPNRFYFFLPKESIDVVTYDFKPKQDICYYKGVPIKGINRCIRRETK